MDWAVEGTDEFADWYGSLSDDEQDAVVAAVQVVEEQGPTTGRPTVDSIKGSRHHNMKEIRVPRNDIRILFCFDRRRSAILLIGGSKTGEWSEWYKEMIPVADNLYDEYLRELEKEGKI